MKILCMLCCVLRYLLVQILASHFAYYSHTQTAISMPFALALVASCNHIITFRVLANQEDVSLEFLNLVKQFNSVWKRLY